MVGQKVVLSDEDKVLSHSEMQTIIQKLVVNAESKDFGQATILVHRFSVKNPTGEGHRRRQNHQLLSKSQRPPRIALK
jgi:hypothetical protein